MRNRAFRISQRSRRRAQAELQLKDRITTRPITPKDIGITANTPVPCSCHMCTNARRVLGNSKPMKLSEFKMSQRDGTE